MRKTYGLAAVLLAVCVTSSFAMKDRVVDRSELETDWEALRDYDLGGPLGAFADTIFFGGDGSGLGNVVQGGTWTFDTPNPAVTPQNFPDGDPVGNEYLDGWTFLDRTARTGPSFSGAPHWRADGTYDFNYDATPEAGPGFPGARPGGFAHRHSFHPHPPSGIPGDPYRFGGNAESDVGPDPLVEPGVGGSWSMWIGTNLFLNPDNCGWGQKSGHGDGWSQGIKKQYTIPQGTPQGTQYQIRFFHRYAIEFDFDTCWVEISFDGRFWQQVGDAANANGIFNDGCHLPDQCSPGGGPGGPLPSVAGGPEVVNLVIWPGNPTQDENLFVRFRVATDAFFSDNNEGGDFFYAWDLDNIALLRNQVEIEPRATFETDLGGWAPASFEGFDFDITTSDQPAGRLDVAANLACPPIVDCSEDCGLDGHFLLFADRDDCDLNDQFQDSIIYSVPFFIAEGELAGVEGRGIRFDWYTDGGAGFFNTFPSLAYVYYPFNQENCPYTPPQGDPGAGETFNWSQTDFDTFDIFGQGTGPDCDLDLFLDVSAFLPASAESVSLHIGATVQCRSQPDCDVNDNGAPFLDNIQFGVFDPSGVALDSDTTDRYSDNFPLSNPGPGQNISQMPARTDGAHSLSQNLGVERPPRWVRSDTAVAKTGADGAALFLRFAVERGPCQTNLNDPWFLQYPPSPPGSFPENLIWHSARMDTARAHQTGEILQGGYMSCYHDADPLNGTHWCGVPPSVEPCDDIISDCLFTPGTRMFYFFEARDANTNVLLGTYPAGRLFAPVSTDPIFGQLGLWIEHNNLPTVTPDCTGEYQNNLLVVSSYQSNAVPGRGTTQRQRTVDVLSSLGLEFDVYDDQGTNWGESYNGIGRREDRTAQQPRPPWNGATQVMLEGYDCVWYYTGLLTTLTVSDSRTLSFFGGQPSQDQQKMETWLQGCTSGNNRLLVHSGISWGSDIDVNTTNGPTYLANRGIDVLASDYAQELANNDLRRCARLAGQGPLAGWEGEALGSGCPDNLNIDVFAATVNGTPLVNFVESFEGDTDPVDCTDDANRPAWHAVVRRAAGDGLCERSVSMSFEFSELYPLNCTDQCLFADWILNGDNAQLVIDIFNFAGKPINQQPIGIDPSGSPRFVNALYQAEPNPANPSARIRYTIASKGLVTLKIFDVSGRQIRTLVNEVQEPTTAGYEVVWDGTSDVGQRVGSGVFFYQIDAPGFTSAKKLVILK